MDKNTAAFTLPVSLQEVLPHAFHSAFCFPLRPVVVHT